MERAASGPDAEADPFQFRGRIYRSLVAVFLVFVVARGALLWWQYDDALSEEQRRSENLALVLAEHLDRTFGAIESALNQLAVYSERVGGPQASPEAWSPVLAAALAGLSGVGSLNVVDADGVVTWSTNPAVTGSSRRDLHLYRLLKDNPETKLGFAPPVPSTFYAGVTIPVGLALHDSNGRFNGLVAATFQPERLRGFYEAINIGSRGTIQVLHPDGFLLFEQPPSGRVDARAMAANPVLAASREGSTHGRLQAPLDAGGEPYLTAWQTLPRNPLIVSVSISRYEALSDWRTEFLILTGVACFMAIVLGIAGMWLRTSNRVHARTVAERDQAGAALRENQSYFQAIMHHTPVLVFVKNLEGRYTFVNRAAEQWIGAGSKPAVGKTSHDIMPKETADLMQSADARVAATNAPVQRQTTIQTPIGQRTMLSTKFPLTDFKGRGLGNRDDRDRYHRPEAGRGPAGAGATHGSRRPAHRRHRPRLQQHADRDPAQRGRARHAAQGRGPTCARRSDAARRRAGRRPDAAAARLRPPSVADAAVDRRQRAARQHGAADAAHAGRAHRDQAGARSQPVAGDRRPEPARERHRQSRRERPRCHAGGRTANDRDRECRARRRLRVRRSRHAAGPLRHGRDQRHRHRHAARRGGARLRAVLHHQGRRQGHRARAEHGLWLHQADRRAGAHLFRGRRGHGRAALSAAIGTGRDRRPLRTSPCRASCRPVPKPFCWSRTTRWCAPIRKPSSRRSAITW